MNVAPVQFGRPKKLSDGKQNNEKRVGKNFYFLVTQVTLISWVQKSMNK